MKFHISTFLLLSALLLSSIVKPLQAQETSIDTLFQQARQLAFQHQLQESRKLCRKILQRKPDYYDARVLLANTYSWQKDYDTARIELKKVLTVDKKHYDALSSLIDIYFWSGKDDIALKEVGLALGYYPNDELFLYKKAKILLHTGNSVEAQRTILHLLNENPKNEGAKKLLGEIKKIRIFNTVSMEYSFEYFKEPYHYRWHMLNVDYLRKTPIGDVVVRAFVADIVYDNEKIFQNNTATQFEIDAYPKISKKNWAYVSYAYSGNQTLFPRQRAAVEIYQKLPHAFELSAGFRFMQFRITDDSLSNVWIFTGTVGKYIKNYWFSFRTYLTPKSAGLEQSYFLIGRRYFGSDDNYVGFEIGTGNSPDKPVDYLTPLPIYKLKNLTIQADGQYRFADQWVVKLIAGYKYTEYKPDEYRNGFYITTRFSYYF